MQVYLVTGGYNDNVGPLSSTEIFVSGDWTLVGSLPIAYSGLAAVSVRNTVIVAGQALFE